MAARSDCAYDGCGLPRWAKAGAPRRYKSAFCRSHDAQYRRAGKDATALRAINPRAAAPKEPEMVKDEDLPVAVKIASRLPMGEANGVASQGDRFIADPEKVFLVLVALDFPKTEVDHAKGYRTVAGRVRRIELVDESDEMALRRIMVRGAERRSGQAVLPFDNEAELEEAFAGLFVDAKTGEIIEAGCEHVSPGEGACEHCATTADEPKPGTVTFLPPPAQDPADDEDEQGE